MASECTMAMSQSIADTLIGDHDRRDNRMRKRQRQHRFKAFVPWIDGTGREWRGWMRLPVVVPFVLVYIIVAWALFWPAAEPHDGNYWIDEDAVGHLIYHIPDLTERPFHAGITLATGTWLNHDAIQLVYVTALLLIFGAPFELREGTLRMVALFFGTSLVAAIFSGFLLHSIHPSIWDNQFLENAWNRSWSGGSAGCFGVMGALAARAPRPILLLAIFIAWECAVWWVNLRNYTSVFHFSALAAGFIAVRWLLPPIRHHGIRHGGAHCCSGPSCKIRC